MKNIALEILQSMRFRNIRFRRFIRLEMVHLVVGASLISFSGVWVKVSHVSPTTSAFYRVLIGGVLLLIAAGMRREIRWYGYHHLLLGLLCGVFFALDLGFYHYSIHYVGPGLGTILPNFQVFILAFVGLLFFGEKLRLHRIVSMPFAVLGLFLIVGVNWHQLGADYQTGIYFGLTAALCYSGFLLSLRKLQSDQQGLSHFYVLMVVSLSTALFLAIALHRTGDAFRIPNLQSLMALGALGIFSQAIGWILIANALPGIRPSLSGLVLLMQPALAFVWDVLFFHRPTTWLNWIGVFMALGAIYLGALGPSRSR